MAANASRDDDTLGENAGKLLAIVFCGFLGIVALVAIFEILGTRPAYIVATMPIFLVSVVLLLAVAARAGGDRFFVAGGRVPVSIAAASGAAVAMPVASVLALAGLLYAFGFDGLCFVLGPAAGLVVGGVLLAPHIARSGAPTIPAFLGLRFGTTARLIAAAVVALCSAMIAVAAVSSAAGIGALAFGMERTWGVWAVIAIALASTLPGGMSSLTWSGSAKGIVMLIGVLAPVTVLMASARGIGLPQIGYGEVLSSVSNLEREMIEKGLASAASLKPHVKPFLQIDSLNFQAIVLSLMAGVAVMPHLLGRCVTAGSARDARASWAWMLVLVFLVLISAPALAALAKHEVYALIASSRPLSSLPDWMIELSRAGTVRLHGLSIALLEAVRGALAAGSTDTGSIALHLAGQSSDLSDAWLALKEPVRSALVEAARALSASAGPDAVLSEFRDRLLPSAALLSGNKQGLVTHLAFEADPAALILALPRLMGQPVILSSVLAAGALAAALALAAAAIFTIATTLAHDLRPGASDLAPVPSSRAWTARALLILTGLAVGAAALSATGETPALVPAALSLAAAGLFPALALGIWWKRASAFGAVLGMIAGLAVAGYYMAGTRYFPLTLHESFAHLSNAAPSAVRRLKDLEAAWLGADEATRGAARAALEAHASGGLLRPGVANWFGISPLASALFGLPAGFLLLVMGSLAAPRPGTTVDDLARRIRTPETAEDATYAPES